MRVVKSLTSGCRSPHFYLSPSCCFICSAAKAYKPGPVMYDLAPILWSYAPEYFTTQAMAIGVETKGDHTFGRTVAISGEPDAHVSTAMRADDVKLLYMDTICGSRD